MTRRTTSDFPVQSFQDVLKDLATLCRNTVRLESSGGEFSQLTESTPFQRRVFELEAFQPDVKPVFGFKAVHAVHVFDISQTEGAEVPKLSEINGSPGLNLVCLEGVYKTLNIKLETRPMPAGVRGV